MNEVLVIIPTYNEGENIIKIIESIFTIHQDINVLIVDDILATGGTAKSAAKLVERIGGRVVGFIFLASLEFLNGRKEIANYPHHALLTYD